MAWLTVRKFGPFTFYNGDTINGGWLLLFLVGRFAIRIGVDPKLSMASPAYSGLRKKRYP